MTQNPSDPASAVAGVVKWFDADEGWGVIEAPEVPGGCFVYFSHIEMDGYRQLHAGQHVRFTFERPGFLQDGYRYRALAVWPPGVRPGTPQRSRPQHGSTTAYRSRLTIRWSDGTVTEGIPEHKRGKDERS